MTPALISPSAVTSQQFKQRPFSVSAAFTGAISSALMWKTINIINVFYSIMTSVLFRCVKSSHSRKNAEAPELSGKWTAWNTAEKREKGFKGGVDHEQLGRVKKKATLEKGQK